jgi:DUF4097 and DUF4098 domain-containing protein YvlB
MMRRLLLTVLTFLVVAGAPGRSQAQSDRIVSVTRTKDRYVERATRTEVQRRNERETQTERFTRTLNIGAEGELDVSNISGDITVTKGSGTSATIEVVKTARAATAEDAKAVLALVQVEVMDRGTRAEVRTRYPNQDERRQRNWRNINVEVTYTIAAPPNTRMVVKSISGNISVSAISGTLALETISGTVRVANAGRITTAKSISGDVEVIDTHIDGELEAGTISGTVTVRRVTARGFRVSSVSGSVALEDVTCDRMEAQSISGDVRYAGDLQPNGRYRFNSHSGSIRVAIGGKSGFQVEATSFSGSFTTDLPLTIQGSQGARGGRQRGVRGSYGDGSAVLNLTTFSGSIVITKR